MQHPFDGILNEDGEAIGRRDCLKTAFGATVGLVVAAQAKDPSRSVTQAGPGHPEHGGRATTKAALSHPEHGGRPMTKAGPNHPEHGGRFDRLKPAPVADQLKQAEAALKKGDWFKAGQGLTRLQRSKSTLTEAQQSKRDELAKTLKTQADAALDKADKQVKAKKLKKAGQVYSQALQLHPSLGLRERAEAGLAERRKGQRGAVTERLGEDGKAMPPPGTVTTFALGEEG